MTQEYVGKMRVTPGASDREVVFTRIIEAPRPLVYQAWTTPEHFEQWWGPKGFTNHSTEIDLRPGGQYRIVMRSPEGVDYPVRGVYLEIVENERLVMTDVVSDEADGHPPDWLVLLNKYRGVATEGGGLQLVLSVTFEDVREGTRLTITSRYESAADRDALMKMGTAEGFSESLDKLEAMLA